MPDKLTELKARLAEVDDLENAAALLEWDQLTMMPAGGAVGRADQSATLQKVAHEKFIADEVGRLLADLGAEFKDAPAENDDAALVRVAARLYRRQTQIPTQLVAEMVRATSIGQSIWAQARAESNFQAFRAQLEKIFDLKRQVAACFPEAASPYDALLEDYEPGATTVQMRAMFDELKRELPPLVQAIAANSTGHEGDLLHGDFDEQTQWDLSLRAVEQLGYDFNRGRQDKTVHPFETSFGLYDVRITNRVRRNHLTACLMGSLHECGHALYDLGYPDKYARSSFRSFRPPSLSIWPDRHPKVSIRLSTPCGPRWSAWKRTRSRTTCTPYYASSWKWTYWKGGCRSNTRLKPGMQR